ncbi:hypothetical protein QBC40DRAFT_291615 [Triangularia verruculosa]|uniref:Uncharacterized protein n=1 Tax=Triangularia verruculosa TaxID=2587418 RepID=A0AAN7B0C1_9PEZI|nr:hypothetical protein QBC40DRAFT_291615 [Triangularia verruculosa]
MAGKYHPETEVEVPALAPDKAPAVTFVDDGYSEMYCTTDMDPHESNFWGPVTRAYAMNPANNGLISPGDHVSDSPLLAAPVDSRDDGEGEETDNDSLFGEAGNGPEFDETLLFGDDDLATEPATASQPSLTFQNNMQIMDGLTLPMPSNIVSQPTAAPTMGPSITNKDQNDPVISNQLSSFSNTPSHQVLGGNGAAQGVENEPPFSDLPSSLQLQPSNSPSMLNNPKFPPGPPADTLAATLSDAIAEALAGSPQQPPASSIAPTAPSHQNDTPFQPTSGNLHKHRSDLNDDLDPVTAFGVPSNDATAPLHNAQHVINAQETTSAILKILEPPERLDLIFLSDENIDGLANEVLPHSTPVQNVLINAQKDENMDHTRLTALNDIYNTLSNSWYEDEKKQMKPPEPYWHFFAMFDQESDQIRMIQKKVEEIKMHPEKSEQLKTEIQKAKQHLWNERARLAEFLNNLCLKEHKAYRAALE